MGRKRHGRPESNIPHERQGLSSSSDNRWKNDGLAQLEEIRGSERDGGVLWSLRGEDDHWSGEDRNRPASYIGAPASLTRKSQMVDLLMPLSVCGGGIRLRCSRGVMVIQTETMSLQVARARFRGVGLAGGHLGVRSIPCRRTVFSVASIRHLSGFPRQLATEPPSLLNHRFISSSPQSGDRPPATARTSNPPPPTENRPARENIYTIPNALTASRILACPVLGWSIIEGDFFLATSILAYAGVSDWVDGYIARRYNMGTVLGSILDPAADKALMTTLTVTLAMNGLLPVPLAVIILGRDVLLSLSAFYIRYKSLPAPKTFSRYWDFGIPSAEVRPTSISKVNTALQLLLMACTTVSPLLAFDTSFPLQIFQWIVAGTTIWSGLGYVFSRNAVRYVARSTPNSK